MGEQKLNHKLDDECPPVAVGALIQFRIFCSLTAPNELCTYKAGRSNLGQ